MERWLTKFAAIAILVGLANLFVAIPVAMALGGSADIGKVEKGRYFLGNHGHYTEVSRGVWVYSKVHMRSLAFTTPLYFLGFAAFAYLERRRRAS
jgi:hypothetical protein